MKTNTYTFNHQITEAGRDALVLTLRNDGFSASREAETLRTDASLGEIALSWGTALDVRELGRKPAPYHARHAASLRGARGSNI